MRSRKSILPGLCKYKESPFKKEKRFEGSKHDTGKVGNIKNKPKFAIEYDAKMKAYSDLPMWKKVFTSNPGVVGGYAPGVGKLSKGGKKIIEAFNKTAPSRRRMIDKIQKSLEKKGYTFGKKKSPLKAIDSRKGPEHVAKQQAIDKKNYKDMKRARRGQK